MSERVIEHLEMIHVQHDDAHRQVLAQRPAPLIAQECVKAATIGQAGQGVGHARRFKHLFGDFAGGDVGVRDEVMSRPPAFHGRDAHHEPAPYPRAVTGIFRQEFVAAACYDPPDAVGKLDYFLIPLAAPKSAHLQVICSPPIKAARHAVAGTKSDPSRVDVNDLSR